MRLVYLSIMLLPKLFNKIVEQIYISIIVTKLASKSPVN